MKKIVVDGKCLASKKISGIERYYIEILTRLDKLVEYGSVEILVPNGFVVTQKFNNIIVKEYGFPLRFFWRQLFLPFYIWKTDAIGLHLNNTAPIFKPDIVCLHDVNTVANPEFFNRTKLEKLIHWNTFSKKIICRYAKHIITDSNFSKNEILKYFECYHTDISVIYLGWQHYEKIEYDIDCLNKFNLKEKEYFFTIGNLAPTKNLKWVLEASKYNPNSTFVVSGAYKPGIFGDEYNSESLKSLNYIGYVTDEEAKTLMRFSKAFLFPTLYEGFGIPPLEAISTGAAVIISDIPCMKEVYGSNAYYINPNNPAINLDSLLSESTIEYTDILNKYSWDKATSQVFELINKFASG